MVACRTPVDQAEQVIVLITLCSKVRPDIHLKAPVAHSALFHGIQKTEGGQQVGPHFLKGCYKSTICSSKERKQSNTSHCWLRGDTDYGSELRGDIEFRGSTVNKQQYFLLVKQARNSWKMVQRVGRSPYVTLGEISRTGTRLTKLSRQRRSTSSNSLQQKMTKVTLNENGHIL